MKIRRFKPKFEYNDLGNSKRYAFMNVKSLRYIPELNTYAHFDGHRWVCDQSGIEVRALDKTLESLVGEVDLFYKKEIDKLEKIISEDRRIEIKLSKNTDKLTEEERFYKLIMYCRSSAEDWRIKSCSDSKMRSMVNFGKSQSGMATSLTEFDSKGLFLGVGNGVLNLKTKELIQYDSNYLMMKHSKVNYIKDADCPEFKKFLSKIMRGNDELIAFMQRLFGQALIGKPIKSHVIFFWGDGANGKSTLVDSISEILHSYAGVAKSDVLTTKSSNDDYHIASMVGKRLMVFNEVKQSSVTADTTIKSLVDSGKIAARHAYGRVFEYQPIFTPIINTNHQPNIEGNDDGIWRRVLLVPFEYTIPNEERRSDYAEAVLMKEAQGILNWCIEGAYQLIHSDYDLNPPECIKASTQLLREDNDRIGAFLDEVLTEHPLEKIRLSDVFNLYKDWSKSNNYFAKGKKNFSAELKRRGIIVKQSHPDNQIYVFGYCHEYTRGRDNHIHDGYPITDDERQRDTALQLMKSNHDADVVDVDNRLEDIKNQLQNQIN